MTCCVIALALAMQVIETWRRIKACLGIKADAEGAALRAPGVAMAGLLDQLRHPAVRYVVFALLIVEGVVAGGWLYGHRAHVGNALAASVFQVSGFAFGLCDGDPTSAPRQQFW
jgi:hypothetical protein